MRSELVRLRLRVTGQVQGVGFRPWVWREATARGLAGAVWNTPGEAIIELQGESAGVAEFEAALSQARPPIRVRGVTQESLAPLSWLAGFRIVDSALEGAAAPTLPPDLAMCADCAREILDPENRRFGYAFITCTACGPRYTLAAALPFDRARTAMAQFPLCPACYAEYIDPGDRRFHAQATACAACGPAVTWRDADGVEISGGGTAISDAVAALRAGQIVALKGLGGFQLLCDARDAAAVARLRARKARPDKPMAVMFPDLDSLRSYGAVSDAEAALLADPAGPILLVASLGGLTEGVLRGMDRLGALLPTTPLHLLLMRAFGGPVVCTSGNRADEPLAIDLDEALARVGPVADGLLDHNRPVLRPADDSVARLDAHGLTMIRRARGFAPAPIALAQGGATALGLGGHLKNTVALLRGDMAILSPHVGDLGDADTLARHNVTVDELLRFHDAVPEVIGCDLHPASTATAEALAARLGKPLVRVQHHHAHALAVLAEHGHSGPAISLGWDGTGYGQDGSIWGGELLCCDATSSRRLASLRAFPMPGSDRASRQPARVALGLFHALKVDSNTPWAREPWARVEQSLGRGAVASVLASVARGSNAPLCSTVGRLFDGVAFLLGAPGRCTWEAQAAMGVESLASAWTDAPYALDIPLVDDGEIARGDWGPMLAAIGAARAAGVPEGALALGFHHALASFGLACARLASAQTGLSVVALAGGCFANGLLTGLLQARLQSAGLTVLLPHALPSGDGAIALGQAIAARARV